MPGFIKVDGQQRPVASPYVKVNGAWTPVALGYVKVGGEWKIWHSAEIEDDFNRANSLTLGTASNGFSQWTELGGSWEIRDNQAYIGSATSSYAVTQLYKATTNYSVSLDIPSNTGLGVGFWIQDASNWHAAIPGSRSQFNPSYYYCEDPTFTLDGSICRKVTTQAAEYEGPFVVDPPPYSVPIYECTSGGSLFGTDCYTTSTYAADYTRTYSYDCNTPRTGGSCVRDSFTSCTCTQSAYATVNYDFVKCGPCSAGQTGFSSTSCPTGTACFVFRAYCVCYGNDVGPTPCSGTCTVTVGVVLSGETIEYFPCNDGSSPVGGVCYETTYNGPATVTGFDTIDPPPYTEPGRGYYCPSSAWVRNGTICTLTQTQNAIFVPASTTYPSVIRLYRMINGVVTTLLQEDLPSDPKSILVTTSGSNVNIQTYNGLGLTGTRTRSTSFSSTLGVKTTGVGLAKYGNQVQRQGTYVDNFRAE